MTIIGFVFAIYSCEKSTVIEDETSDERVDVPAQVRSSLAARCNRTGYKKDSIDLTGITMPFEIEDFEAFLDSIGFDASSGSGNTTDSNTKGLCSGGCGTGKDCTITKLISSPNNDVWFPPQGTTRFAFRNEQNPPKNLKNMVVSFQASCNCK